jgi:CRISPR-associated exonuclease Cas4
MKLREIEISNYRSINNLKVSIDDFIVLIGENNSGKSSVLKGVELFYSESLKGFNSENFHFKDTTKAIEITLTFDRLTDEEKEQKYIKHWIFNEQVKIKRVIAIDSDTQKLKSSFYGWQAKPLLEHFDLSKFEDYKANLTQIVTDNNLPDYFRTPQNKVTQASYKEGLRQHIEAGLVEFGEPGWIANPGGLSENFASLLPQFYLVPAVKDAQDDSKITQTSGLGKLINDLTNRIVTANPKFAQVKTQIDGLKKFLNRAADGTDVDRLEEIKDLEKNLSDIISESMPDSKVEIEIVTPDLIDLFKETKITIDDSIPTSIENKGHGLQRALIFSYIRAYAKLLNEIKVGEETKKRNFILAIEEPELFLHPNGQRKMMSVLRDIAKDDQVLMCSHSSFFVDMFQYPKIAIVKRDGKGPTYSVQYTGDIFEDEDQKKSFRYLSFFDISTSELFFARKVVLVEGDTEKQIIPYWASKLSTGDKRYDFSANNICVTACGGKTNFSAFMKVLNNLKIPYVVIHDIDPIDFPEDKPDKTEKEQHSLRMFKENLKIEALLSADFGKLIKVNPELEPIIGVSNSQAEKHGKVRAAYFKYDGINTEDYPEKVLELMKLIIEWTPEQNSYELTV